MKVLAVKVAEIKKLGKCPADTSNGKPNFQAVVSFCLNIESLIQGLTDLADEEEDEDIRYGVYSPSVRDSIQNLFGTRDIMNMRALKGKGKVALEEHIKYEKTIELKLRAWFSQRILRKSRVEEMIRKNLMVTVLASLVMLCLKVQDALTIVGFVVL